MGQTTADIEGDGRKTLLKHFVGYLHTEFRNIMGPAAKAVVYKYGLYVGFNLCCDVRKKSGSTGRTLMDDALTFLESHEFGAFTVLEFDEKEKHVKVSVKNAIEHSLDEKINPESCWFLTGLLAGAVKEVFNAVVICREISCSEKECVFEVTPWDR